MMVNLGGLAYTHGATLLRAVVEDRATSFLTGFDDLSATVDRRSEWRCRVCGRGVAFGGVAARCDRKPVMLKTLERVQGLSGEEVSHNDTI